MSHHRLRLLHTRSPQGGISEIVASVYNLFNNIYVQFQIKNCLDFPAGEQIGKNRTPSFRYPSDHFSLVCDFELLPPTENGKESGSGSGSDGENETEVEGSKHGSIQ